jgi:histidine ammonia-lyase
VILDGRLEPRDVVAIAASGEPVELDPTAMEAVARSRARLEAALAEGARVYGISTGLGALVDEPLPAELIDRSQCDLLRSHAAGTGAPLPRAAVRAAMAVRLNGLLLGHSGVRPVVVERVAGLLNADLVPVVPRTGSLGASGDLAPSAHAFLPLIGEGQVTDGAGATMSGREALAALGAEPLTLRAKEALALVNGTHFMSGIGALAGTRAGHLLDTADAIAAASLEALGGTLAPFDERVHRLRPIEGQSASAANVRAAVAGSERLRPDGTGSLQDAYSLRCVPQVHGAAREAHAFFTRLVTADLNAVTDNPLVFDEPPAVVSAGNFHGQALALAFDTLRLALADLGSIAERRIFRLVSPSANSGLPAFLTPTPGPSSGLMVAQYTAAALLAELRALAHPVSVDSVPTSDNQEDHVSMGMTAALMTLDALDRLRAVLAIELLCASQALDLRPGRSGDGTARLHAAARARVPTLTDDRPPAPDIEALAALIAEGELRP